MLKKFKNGIVWISWIENWNYLQINTNIIIEKTFYMESEKKSSTKYAYNV